MSDLNNEPSLEQIDDYSGKESKSKKRVVYAVVLFCLLVGAVLTYLKSNSSVNDYEGTKENPGINTTNG